MRQVERRLDGHHSIGLPGGSVWDGARDRVAKRRPDPPFQPARKTKFQGVAIEVGREPAHSVIVLRADEEQALALLRSRKIVRIGQRIEVLDDFPKGVPFWREFKLEVNLRCLLTDLKGARVVCEGFFWRHSKV